MHFFMRVLGFRRTTGRILYAVVASVVTVGAYCVLVSCGFQASSRPSASKNEVDTVHAAFLGAADVLASTGQSAPLRPYWESKLILEHASQLSSRGFQAVLGVTSQSTEVLGKSMVNQLEHFLLRISPKLSEGSNLVLAFSAHGSESQEKVAFLDADGQTDWVNPGRLAFHWSAVTDPLKARDVELGTFVLLMDACHVGDEFAKFATDPMLQAQLPPASTYVIGFIAGSCSINGSTGIAEINGQEGGQSSLLTPWIQTLERRHQKQRSLDGAQCRKGRSVPNFWQPGPSSPRSQRA